MNNSKGIDAEKQDVPPCIYCSHCKISSANGSCAFYFCGNSYKVDEVTGIKNYSYCSTVRYSKRCSFKSSFFYKLKRFLSKEDKEK